MNFEVVYHEAVVREDIPSLSTEMKAHVKGAIEEKLTTYPDLFGLPLRRSLKGYRKLRVGDWRVIFRVERQRVKVFLIAHRSVVYQRTENRIQ